MAHFITHYNSEYDKLYTEFANKWNFSLSLAVGCHSLVLSNGYVFRLFKVVSDKRTYTGIRLKKIFEATSFNDMHKYLDEHLPE